MESVLELALDCVVGALESDVDATGATFHRAPASARARLADRDFDFVNATPSGVRFEMLTDATQMELEVPDGVHPNAAGYRLMAERFLASTQKRLIRQL